MIAMDQLPLVVVEDSDEDFETLRWALRKVGVQRPVRRCASAQELFDYLRRATHDTDSREPALILLDLNLGGAEDGHAVLTRLKADSRHCRIPVVVWTSSTHPDDITRSYASGASGYTTKPSEVGELVMSLRRVAEYWFETVVLPGRPLHTSRD